MDCKRRLHIKGASHPDRIKEIGGRALISDLREEHVREIRSRFLPATVPADEAVEAEARPKPNAALALLLLLYTGQRAGDVAAMKWVRYDGKGVEVWQQKTDELLWTVSL